MDLDFVVFPAPKPNFTQIKELKKDLIFIPKNKKENKYIPTYLLRAQTKSPSKNFIIMFHGNAEDMFGSLTMAEALRDEMQMNILLVEYPGYSIYNEPPNEKTILENTIIVYDFLKKKFKIKDYNIFIFGRSLGTSPAIYLASKRNPACLFVVSAFTSIKAVAKNFLGFLSFIVGDRFKSIEFIKDVQCPIKFIHGQADPLIPCEETIKLADLCNCIKDVSNPIMMTHNMFDLSEDIVNPIKEFVDRQCELDNEHCNEFRDELFAMPEVISDWIDKQN